MKNRGPEILLVQMLNAARNALAFVEGMDKAEFLGDVRTQYAVAMSLLTIGEIVVRLSRDHPGLVEQYPQIPWAQIKAMRNRIAHGYFELDFIIVWETVQQALPPLAASLISILDQRGQQPH